VRSPISGIFITSKRLGDVVDVGDKLGIITNPFGDHEYAIYATQAGVIIGNTVLPLANEGDALYHIATFGADQMPTEDEIYPYIDPRLQ
jgi:predicted deacylase